MGLNNIPTEDVFEVNSNVCYNFNEKYRNRYCKVNAGGVYYQICQIVGNYVPKTN